MEYLYALEIHPQLTLLVPLAGPEAGHGVALAWDGDVVATSASPIAIQTFRGAVSWHRGAYSAVRCVQGGLLARGVLRVGGARIEVDDSYTAQEGRLYIDRSVAVYGTVPDVGFLSALEWRLVGAGQDDPRFIPGVWYLRNEHVPAYAVGSPAQRAKTGYAMMIREDRLPLPLLMRFDPVRARAFSLAHVAAQPQTIAADDGDEPLVDERLAFGALGEYDSGATVAFWFPGTEGDVLYPPMWTLGLGNSQTDSPVNPFGDRSASARAQGWSYRYHPLRDGVRHAYRLCVILERAPAYHAAVSAIWRQVYAEYRPEARAVDLARVEQVSLQLLTGQVRRDPTAIGIPTWIDCFTGREGRLQDTFGIGFVSRNLEAAYLLLDAGHQQHDPGLLATGAQIVDFWVAHGGLGLSHVELDRKSGAWIDSTDERGRPCVYLRDQSEAHLSALQAWLLERAHGREHQDWLAWARSYADWLLAHSNGDGSIFRAYDLSGQPVSRATCDGIHAVPFLLAMARAAVDPAYAQAAEDLASYLWHTYHRHGEFIGGTLNNPNCYDKEACALALEAYLALHDATGERAWLQAAELAAQLCETWIVMWDIPMPIDERSSRFYGDVTTVGLQLITTGFSAVDMYLSRHAADFARLARLTGDRHYADVAEILLHNTKLMVQLADEYGYAQPGLQIEHWAIGRGRGFGLNSGWLPWVSTSHIIGIRRMSSSR